MGTLVADLAAGRTLIETHISWVLLENDYVYKLKKPVDFGFLDFTTLELRQAACLTEVRLNSRLTHDVYLGVRPVMRDAAGHHAIEGNGEIVDYCVHMRRLDENDRFDSLLTGNAVSPELIRRLARHLAQFHERSSASKDIDHFGDVSIIRRNVEENFAQTRAHLAEFMSPADALQLERTQLNFLERNAARFAARVQAGKIRDGHGDLRLEHIYCTGEHFEVLDCIEFNDRFRYADVACDIAFATMELRQAGHAELAETLLAEYTTDTSDFSLYALIDFYESYRAVVRAKVNSFVALDSQAADAPRRLARERATQLLSQALGSVTPRSPGTVIAVGGLIAAGKSHTSMRLSELANCPIVASDRVRKHLLRVDRYTNVAGGRFAGAYSTETTQQTYATVRQFAMDVVRSGRTVVIDASFRSHEERAALSDWCSKIGSELLFVECVAAHDVLRARLRQRALAPSVSDGREELFDAFLEKYEPPNELPASARCTLDTTLPDAEQSRILQAFVSDVGT